MLILVMSAVQESSKSAAVQTVSPRYPRPGNAPPVVRLIFDTDMGNDIDDALALGVIHALQNRRECELLAVTVTKDNEFSAPFVDLVNTFYGRGDIQPQHQLFAYLFLRQFPEILSHAFCSDLR
jgi:hypothetical protein